ncbi:MAG TPA: aldehyde dehydrogenase family protein, partial [Actinomycetes bacterium]|nr:aldehyde dehydrogenase family protein [Actinomycetes bacterium]
MVVDGGPYEGTGGDRLQVLDPAVGEAFEEVPAGTPADVDAAVAAAQAAFEGWWATP